LNGFGNWHYGATDENNAFEGATPDGAYDNVNLSLVLSAELSPTVIAYTQVFWGQHETLEDDRESEAELEVAAVQWNIQDNLGLRFGRSRLPFGIYTELWDAGIARPFVDLPQSLYGPSNILGEFYDGLGVTGSVSLGGSNWSLAYDAYVGAMALEFLEPAELLFDEEDEEEEREEGEEEVEPGLREVELSDMIGGRLILETPVVGLSFGISAYRADIEEGFERGAEEQTVFGVHGEYLSDRWSVRAEMAEAEVDERRHASYLEVAYQPSARWQFAAKYEHLETEEQEEEDEEGLGDFDSLLEHDEVAFGVNYWVNPKLVLKLSYHLIEGNHLALPTDFFEQIEEGAVEALDDSTRMILFGVSFAF
jgi:hypothetical protein